MRYLTCHNIQFCLIILFILPIPALATPAITCHCFNDRSFNPAKPALADPYFLATAQNSFFAVVFNADKKTIVMKKQQGTSSEDLWIAYWVASKSERASDTLLEARHKNKAWKDIILPLRITSKSLGPRFSNALNAQSSTAQLAEAVVEEQFIRHKLLPEVELTAMRQAGATNQELIIATVIAAKTRQSVKQIYLDVKRGLKTWGALLQAAKIDPKEMQREISGMLKL